MLPHTHSRPNYQTMILKKPTFQILQHTRVTVTSSPRIKKSYTPSRDLERNHIRATPSQKKKRICRNEDRATRRPNEEARTIVKIKK